jgi:cholesterol oxidase
VTLSVQSGAPGLEWHLQPWFKRFVSDDPAQDVRFIIGSCRYPGSWFDQEHADAVFGEIKRYVSREPGIDHLILCGDQIYADATYSLLDIAEDRERYQQAYRRAFDGAYAKWVMANVPTYFAVDDHEFRDDFPKRMRGDTPKSFQNLAAAAAQEAWNFLMHHDDVPAGRDNRLWYSFESRGFPFFVFDTRSERDLAAANVDRLIGPEQKAGFARWTETLTHHDYAGKPIFLVTGSPFFPIPTDELQYPAHSLSSDTLRAFPEFFDFVFGELAQRAIVNPVILMSGDLHYSCVQEFTAHATGATFHCVAVVSSGLSAPLPFANARVDEFDAAKGGSFVPQNSQVVFEFDPPQLVSTSRSHALHVTVRPADGDHAFALEAFVVQKGAGASCVINLQ